MGEYFTSLVSLLQKLNDSLGGTHGYNCILTKMSKIAK